MYVKKVAKRTAIINRSKHIVSKESLSFLHASLTEPHLAYCVEVWGNSYKSNQHPLYVKKTCYSSGMQNWLPRTHCVIQFA